jgi:hypothetical protein
MPVLGLKVNTSRLESKLKAYVREVQAKVETELPAIAAEVLEDIRARTPSPDTEYEYLMTGGGTSGGVSKLVPRAGDRSGDSDTAKSGAERIRFMRNPGLWLHDLVVDPRTFEVDTATMTVRIGKVPELEALSKFSWQNRDRAGNEYPNESPYGVWSFFEYGTEHEVSPRGIGYPLRPDDMTHHLDMPYSMFKSYPRFGMYSDFNKSTFIEAVKLRIRDVKF